MVEKKLFLLDAMALIYRAHFAFIRAPRVTSKGVNTSAIFGFTNTLLEVLQKENPTHIAVVFDTPAPTFRHIQYEAYKAQRDAQPEDITFAIPQVVKLMKAMNIACLELDGYEADDVIGTIAKKAKQEGFEVYMMTPDKDYGQLVEPSIYIYKPAFLGKSAEVLGVNEILERWQVERIDQVVDILGLMGDAVDNIPGIPGVGEKTAQKLIAQYGSVESLLENAQELKGKLGERVRENGHLAVLSKQLALIDTQVPIDFVPENLARAEINREQVSQLFDELEFRTLRKRVLGDDPLAEEYRAIPVAPKAKPGQLDLFNAPASDASSQEAQPKTSDFELSEPFEDTGSLRTIANTRHHYHIVDTEELRSSLITYLLRQEVICFDTETTGTNALDSDLVGLSFAYIPGEAFYVPVPADRAEAEKLVHAFKSVFENPSIGKIAQNIKYDMQVLARYGVQVEGKLWDTMLEHYLVEPEKRHNMDILAEDYLRYIPISIETLIGKKGVSQGNMKDVDLQAIAEYAAEDADITLQLHYKLMPEVESRGAKKLLEEVEMPLVRVLMDMEMEGVNVDLQALKEMSKTLENDIKVLEREIYEIAGMPFNLNSPKQLGEVLFEKMELIKNPKKTKTGQYATGEEILSRLENEHEIARKILDYRELQKLKSTYVDALPTMINSQTGHIHTSYNQAVAATGRLSSNNPNLQNIPIRTPRGREIRKAFVPRGEEYRILSADYSQIELRIMAAFSGDKTMLEAFNQGQDIHASTAAKVFKVPLEEVNSEMRRKAKMVNFGIIYGISAFGLGQRLGISRTEAGEIINAYFEQFPAVKAYMDKVVNDARENQYVETILGRRRYLPDINSRNQTNRGFAERNAINAPIQGSAADMIKVAMIQIHDFIKRENLRSRMILQVHDELVFDAHQDEIEYLSENVDRLMREAIPLPVKMATGIGIGANWLEAH